MTVRTRSFFKIIDLRLVLTPLATVHRTYFEGSRSFSYLDIYVFGVRIIRFSGNA